MLVRDLLKLREPRRLWQRVLLYARRTSPRLRWADAAGFSAVWPDVRARTLVDEARCQMLYQLARHASGLEGSMAEVGVYRGGTAKLLARVTERSGRQLHLFDTFAGMPETDAERDLHGKGDFGDTSLEDVRRLLGPYGARVVFHPGEFPHTTETVREARFSLVHVDVDIAASVEACCAFFYPRVVPGGVIVFDDYGFTSCPGAKQATDAFFADKPEPVLHLVTSQAIVLKLS